MKVNNPLSNILSSKVKVDCLRHMCLYPKELNGRELSRYLNVTHRSVHKAMRSLVDEGVVDFISHGNSFGYKLNREKWITKKMLLPLFKSEKVLLEAIMDKIRKEMEESTFRENILSVVLFGSVNRKEDKNSSDFDIFILVDKEDKVSTAEEEIQKVGGKLSKEYGIVLGPYVKSLASFRKDKSLSVIKSILSSNKLIYGKELTEYVR
jgi:predicted nucleotidyltransferase